MSDEEKAQELISIFVCDKDRDLESFLKVKAILFERFGKSRTFLQEGEVIQNQELY